MRYVAQRIIQTVLVLVIVTFLTFCLVRVVPGDPALAVIGTTQEALERSPDGAERLAEVQAELGLDKSIPAGYFDWFSDIVLHQDFGFSHPNTQPAIDLLRPALPRSAALMIYSIVLSLLIAVPVGIMAAYREGGFLDKLTTALSFGIISLPSFILAILLIFVFSTTLGWFPSTGVVDFSTDPFEHFKSYVLPSFALALPQAAVYSRVLRTDMIATLREDFIGTAKAKGLGATTILFRHALRPSSFSLLTVTAINVGGLIGGSVIIEFLFGINGMGTQLISAMLRSNYVVVQASVAIVAFFFVTINLIVDIAYGVLDPRIRHAR